jgi:hypothetical protein
MNENKLTIDSQSYFFVVEEKGHRANSYFTEELVHCRLD